MAVTSVSFKIVHSVSCGSDPQKILEGRETLKLILQEIDRLPEQERAAFVLREVERLPYDEIAEAMGISEGKVMALTWYARKALQKALADVRRTHYTA